MSRPSSVTRTRTVDKLVTACKSCRRGIFAGQSYTWRTAPTIGMVHTACAG